MPGAILPSGRGRALALVLGIVLSLGAAAGLRVLLRLLKTSKLLQRKREARLAYRRKLGLEDDEDVKIHGLLVACTPYEKDVKGGEGVEGDEAVEACIAKMNTEHQGIVMQKMPFGSHKMGREELLTFLGKPDITWGMTHCVQFVAEDTTATKMHLHSPIHMYEFFAQVGPRIVDPKTIPGCAVGGVVDFHVPLKFDLNPEGKEDPLVYFAFIRFQPYVLEDSELYGQMQAAVQAMSHPGCACALSATGIGPFIYEDWMKELMWNDNSAGFTHCFLVAADSPQCLKELQETDAYKHWMATEIPHLTGDGGPPVLVFATPLKIKATLS